jgi:hypothetical protein
MAKIDVTKIPGYAEMSAEDKIKALEAYKTEDPDYSGYVRKEVFDRTASELAAKKKELSEKLSAEEKTKQEEQEKLEDLQNKYNTLLHENQISSFKAELLGLGYEDKLAADTAKAMADGDTAKVFANQKKHLENVEKNIQADILKNTPKPGKDSGGESMTLTKLKGMSSEDRLKFYQEHTDEYKALYEGDGE